MTEHEKLKKICDKIGFTISSNYTFSPITKIYYSGENRMDVREIIFTQDFMDKYIDYCLKFNLNDKGFSDDLLFNLNNPVKYLSEFIGFNNK